MSKKVNLNKSLRQCELQLSSGEYPRSTKPSAHALTDAGRHQLLFVEHLFFCQKWCHRVSHFISKTAWRKVALPLFFLNFSSMCLFIFFKFYFIFKLYNIVLVLPNIKMNPPQVYMCSPS